MPNDNVVIYSNFLKVVGYSESVIPGHQNLTVEDRESVISDSESLTRFVIFYK